jgi:hypothetical protein
MIFLQRLKAGAVDGAEMASHEGLYVLRYNALCWSSGKWSKVRGMATVRPDQAGLDSYVDPDEAEYGRILG